MLTGDGRDVLVARPVPLGALGGDGCVQREGPHVFLQRHTLLRLLRAAFLLGYVERGSLVIGFSRGLLSPPLRLSAGSSPGAWTPGKHPQRSSERAHVRLANRGCRGPSEPGPVAAAAGGTVTDLLSTSIAAGLRGSVCVLGPGPRCGGAAAAGSLGFCARWGPLRSIQVAAA